MTARSKANDSASIEVEKVKVQIANSSGIAAANLSIDQMIRLARKSGFTVIVSCVKVS